MTTGTLAKRNDQGLTNGGTDFQPVPDDIRALTITGCRAPFRPTGKEWMPFAITCGERENILSAINVLNTALIPATSVQIERSLLPVALRFHLRGRFSCADDAKAMARVTAIDWQAKDWPLWAIEKALNDHFDASPHWPERADIINLVLAAIGEVKTALNRCRELLAYKPEIGPDRTAEERETIVEAKLGYNPLQKARLPNVHRPIG